MPFLRLLLVLIVLDATLTLTEQPPAYWAGEYQLADELNLPFRWLLQQGPWFFVVGVAVVTTFGVIVLTRTNHRLRSSVFFLGAVAHFIGVASWLVLDTSRLGWGALLIVALFCARHVEAEWSKFDANDGQA